MTQDEIIETNRRQMFAFARGARVQRQQESMTGKLWWEDVRIQWGLDDELRIHPDDEHLQYGPISTALREMAEDDSWKPCPYRVLANVAANKFQVYLGGIRDDYPLFYLILAEFLADEGM